MNKSRLLTIILFTASTLLAGCNTMHGMGQDVESGGQKIQKESDRNR